MQIQLNMERLEPASLDCGTILCTLEIIDKKVGKPVSKATPRIGW
jgi:hypothetical protein